MDVEEMRIYLQDRYEGNPEEFIGDLGISLEDLLDILLEDSDLCADISEFIFWAKGD